MARIVAALILFIPGVIAAFGIKLMRDALFNESFAIFVYTSIQFIAGFILFIAGLAFIGGFIFYRDKKKRKDKLNHKQNI